MIEMVVDTVICNRYNLYYFQWYWKVTNFMNIYTISSSEYATYNN